MHRLRLYEPSGSGNYRTLGTSVQRGAIRFKNYETRTVNVRVVILAIKNAPRANNYGEIRED